MCYQRIVQFFGHISPRQGDYLENFIDRWTRLVDQMKEETDRTQEQLVREAEDRGQWRKIVNLRVISFQIWKMDL